MYVRKLWLITKPLHLSAIVWLLLNRLIFSKVIMQCDVTRCITCTSNKAEYLDKERSCKNSTKEVILWLQVIFAMQPREYWANFRFIGTLKTHCHLLRDVILPAWNLKKFTNFFKFVVFMGKEWCFIIWLNMAYYTTKVSVINTQSSIYVNLLK